MVGAMRYVAGKSLFVAAAGLALTTPGSVGAAETSAASIVAAVERICLPLLSKQPIETVASSTGLAKRDGEWTLRFQGAGAVRISPPSPANPTVCMGSVEYERANEKAIVEALAEWAGAKGLKPVKTGERTKNAYLQYRTSSWSGRVGGKATTVIFTEQTELDGRPTAGALDEAALLVSAQP